MHKIQKDRPADPLLPAPVQPFSDQFNGDAVYPFG